MNTQKISMMKLVEAELKNRVDETQPELSKIDMIVRLSEVRSTIEDLENNSSKKEQNNKQPPKKKNNHTNKQQQKHTDKNSNQQPNKTQHKRNNRKQVN